MDPLTALIADDEPNLRIHLRELLTQVWPEIQIVAECGNGGEALQALDNLRPSVAFLDIKMPLLSGIEVAQSTQSDARLVFVTAYDDFAVQAFEQQAVDYLLKPASIERLTQTVSRLKTALLHASPLADMAALAKLLRQTDHTRAASPDVLRFVRASRGDTVYQIPMDEILFFQSDNKVTLVQTARHEYAIRTPLSELIDQLDSCKFLQVHRSSIVNLDHVLSARRDMTGNMQLSLRSYPHPVAVARAYQAHFKQM